MVIRYVQQELGPGAADQVVAASGESRERLLGMKGWTSFAVYERVWKAAVEVSGGDHIGRAIGQYSVSAEPLGLYLTLGRAIGLLGSIPTGMRYLPDVINRSSRCVTYRLLSSIGNSAVFEVQEPPGVEFSRARCNMRLGFFESLPFLRWTGVQDVKVRHSQCAGDGYGTCVYELHWTQAEERLSPLLVAAIAGGVGLAMGGLSWVFEEPLSVIARMGLCGFALTALAAISIRRARSIEENVSTLIQHRNELHEARADLDDRFHELNRAHEELERRSTELNLAQKELVRSERLGAMGRMVSGVAHEINNPLAAILATAEIIEKAEKNPNTLELIYNIIAQVERCRRLVRRMLEFVRVQPMERLPINIVDVVQGSVDLLRHRLRLTGIGLRMHSDESVAVVDGDYGQLQQVVLNLLENGIHALEKFDGDRTISVAIEQSGDRVTLEIVDSGMGVDDEIRDQIFEPFFTTKEVGVGTGLGLSIAYGIISAHQGALELLPGRPNSGAHFRISLPSSDEVPDTATLQFDSSVEMSVASIFGPLNILVVDDEVVIRRMVQRLLEGDGHHVTGADCVATARKMMEEGEPPDVLVLDVLMPGESGLEYYDDLDPEMQKRVVFITGNLMDDVGQRLHGEFGIRCLAKPFSYESLLDGIGAVIRNR